jgi:hypothetical protein
MRSDRFDAYLNRAPDDVLVHVRVLSDKKF